MYPEEFSNEWCDIYFNYLRKTSQKEDSVREISSKLKLKGEPTILCVGGGSGEGDLEIIKNLDSNPRIYYVDPSRKMSSFFLKKLKELSLEKHLMKSDTERFESKNYAPPESDLIL